MVGESGERERVGEKEGEREGGKEGRREGWREARKEGWREGGREGGRERCPLSQVACLRMRFHDPVWHQNKASFISCFLA